MWLQRGSGAAPLHPLMCSLWGGRDSVWCSAGCPLTRLQSVSTNSCGICTSLNLIYLRPQWEQRSRPRLGSYICIRFHTLANYTLSSNDTLPPHDRTAFWQLISHSPRIFRPRPSCLSYIELPGLAWNWEWDEFLLWILWLVNYECLLAP